MPRLGRLVVKLTETQGRRHRELSDVKLEGRGFEIELASKSSGRH